MVPRLSAMKYIAAYRLWLEFAAGSQGEVDLEPELWREVLEPLRNQAYFKTVQLDKELNTIHWDNGAAICRGSPLEPTVYHHPASPLPFRILCKRI